MKYTTLYPHQRHQNLARLLLTIWLFTICSPEATCSPKATCSPEATLAVSPSASPASIEEVDGWVVVSPPESSSTGPKEEPPQAPNVAATLSKKENPALLAKVEEAQRACAGGQTTTSSPTNTPRQQHSEQSPTKTYEQKLPSLQGFQEAISSIANLAKRYTNHLLPIVVVGLLWTYAPYGLSPSAFLELTRSDAKRTNIAIEKMKENNMLSPGIDDKLQQAIDRLFSGLFWRFCWGFCWRAGVVMLTFWGSSFSLTFRQKLVASYERPV